MLLLASGLALGAWLVFLAFDDEKPAVRRPPRPPTEVPPPVVDTVEPAPAPSPVERSLGITGRVLRRGLEPAVGVSVRIGEERATTDAFGVFDFEAASRPRTSQVSVLASDTLLARWSDVLTGDRDDSVALAEPVDLPPAPVRLRWTVHLGLESHGDVEHLRVEEVLAEEWGTGARVRLRGPSTFPPGARLDASLYFEGLRFLSSLEPALSEEQGFEVSVYCPFETVLYSGTYEGRVTYNQILQTAEFRQSLPAVAESGLVSLQQSESKAPFFVGSPQEAVREDEHAQDYYCRVYRDIDLLYRDLNERLKEVRRLGQGWDPALHASGGAARAGWFQVPLFDAEGRFSEEGWRRFLDEEWRPGIRAALAAHDAHGAGKYTEASHFTSRALTALEHLSLVYSKFVVYPMFALPAHPNDSFRDEEEGGDQVLMKRTIDRSLYELEKFCSLVSAKAATTPPWR